MAVRVLVRTKFGSPQKVDFLSILPFLLKIQQYIEPGSETAEGE